MKISDKERDWIFDKLNKIQQIVNTNFDITEDRRGTNASASIGRNIITIGLTEKYIYKYEDGYNDYNILTVENINYINNRKDFDNYCSVCPFIKIFLHELSHHLTMFINTNINDVELYHIHKNNNGGMFIDAENYRKLPFEKLADNLAYMLWENNQEIIEAILYDEDYEITQERISNNLKLANRMKRQYIPEYANVEIV